MLRPHRVLLACAGALALMPACRDRVEEPTAPDPAPPRPAPSVETAPQHHGFAVWHDDFPESPRLSPRRPGRWYDKTRRGALESVAKNLSGMCSREAWLFAKEFFVRVPPDDAEILIRTLDDGLQSSSNDLVETTLGAMARVGDSRFGRAILRALEYRTKGIQNAATRALATCATPGVLLEAGKGLMSWHGSAQAFWFEAATQVLGPAVAAQKLREALAEPRLGSLRSEFVDQALTLPPEHAAEALRDFWDAPPQGLEATMLGLRNAVGDPAAAAVIRELLLSEAPQRRTAGLNALRHGGQQPFRDLVLVLTTDPDQSVRFATLDVLDALGGEDSVAALESLALDEAIGVRQGALLRLRQLGRHAMLDEAVEDLRTATGSNLEIRMADLVNAGYGPAVSALVERMEGVPLAERRRYLQAIAHLKSAEGFGPLRDIFLAEPVNFGREDRPNPALESRAYVALLMINLVGAEEQIVELFESIDKADYVRRAHLLSTLAAIAVDRNDPAIANRCYDAMRAVLLESAEIPQMRLLALNFLVRGLTLADVPVIARMTREEQPAMQRALNDFLLEYF